MAPVCAHLPGVGGAASHPLLRWERVRTVASVVVRRGWPRATPCSPSPLSPTSSLLPPPPLLSGLLRQRRPRRLLTGGRCPSRRIVALPVPTSRSPAPHVLSPPHGLSNWAGASPLRTQPLKTSRGRSRNCSDLHPPLAPGTFCKATLQAARRAHRRLTIMSARPGRGRPESLRGSGPRELSCVAAAVSRQHPRAGRLFIAAHSYCCAAG